MAYDPARKVSVLFGGNSDSGTLNDLWEWDGVSWTNRTPLTLPAVWPAPRADATLVWDEVASRMLLFGGSTDRRRGALSELWSWDGIVWTDLTPNPLPADWPAKRMGHGAAFDSCRGVMLVFGGVVDDPGAFAHPNADLWQWDSLAATFQDLTPPMPLDLTLWPLKTSLPAVAVDAAYDRLIIIGGSSSTVDTAPFMYVYGP
jgi:hypothetical protein